MVVWTGTDGRERGSTDERGLEEEQQGEQRRKGRTAGVGGR